MARGPDELLANVRILGTPPVLALLADVAEAEGNRELWEVCEPTSGWEHCERDAALVRLDLVDEIGNPSDLGRASGELLRELLRAGATFCRPPADYGAPAT